MKTLSNLKFMAMALFVAMLSMSLTACGDDDDDDGGSGDGNGSIVGTWYRTEYGQTVYFVFNSNKTGSAKIVYDNDLDDDSANFDYIIETATDGSQTIKFIWTGDSYITFLNNTKYSLTISNSQLIIGSRTYYRQK